MAAPGTAPGATATGTAIRTEGLTKRYRGGQVAVGGPDLAGIDLTVPTGAVFGFLGPNGSGKTTTIRMLLGLIAPTAGTIDLLGSPVPQGFRDVLPRVGALVEGPAFHPYLSGRANLRRLDAVDRTADPRTSKARVETALERVGLAPAATKRFRTYSLGMKQRLGIAAALLVERELLILDEPTNGLDPQGTREIRVLVRDLAAEGRTVLVSSHLLAEIEQVATHVGIMSAGRLVAQGPLGEVLGGRGGRVTVRTPDLATAREALQRNGFPAEEVGADTLAVELGERPVEEVAALLVGAGCRLRGLAPTAASLESLFVELTGEGFDVAG